MEEVNYLMLIASTALGYLGFRIFKDCKTPTIGPEETTSVAKRMTRRKPSTDTNNPSPAVNTQ